MFLPHLIRLGDVGENGVHHSHEHTVLERVSRVFDDRDDVGARLGHVDQVAPGTMRKLYSVDAPRRPHDIRNVRDSRASSCTKIQYLSQKNVASIGQDCGKTW